MSQRPVERGVAQHAVQRPRGRPDAHLTLCQQIVWVLGRARHHGSLPVHSPPRVLDALLRTPADPAPWQRLGDKYPLLAAALVLHRAWPDGREQPLGRRAAVSLLGTRHLWTLRLTAHGHEAHFTHWQEQLCRDVYEPCLRYDLEPVPGGRVSPLADHRYPWVLRRAWPASGPDPPRVAALFRPGPPQHPCLPALGPHLLCQRRALRPDPPALRALPPLRLRPDQPAPTADSPRRLLARRRGQRRCRDFYWRALARQMRGPLRCDDCRPRPFRPAPALCFQDAWAVVVVAAAPPVGPAPPPLRSPLRAAHTLLKEAEEGEGLVDLRALRWRCLPSVWPPPTASQPAHQWTPAGQRLWGPLLGDDVLVHRAPLRLGGTRARCYSVLTAGGGLITLVVRVDHAPLWAQQARELNWRPGMQPWVAPHDTPHALYALRAQPAANPLFARYRDDDDDDDADPPGSWNLHGRGPPVKVYWWPAGLVQPPAQGWWGWRPPPRPPAACHPPCPAALVYAWRPAACSPLARRLERLARRQRHFLQLCRRVRREAGRDLGPNPQGSGYRPHLLDHRDCFYAGCRGARPRLPPGCGPRPDDPPPVYPPRRRDRRRVYAAVAAYLRSGSRAPYTCRQMALETSVDHRLFLRATAAELLDAGARRPDMPPQPGLLASIRLVSPPPAPPSPPPPHLPLREEWHARLPLARARQNLFPPYWPPPSPPPRELTPIAAAASSPPS